MPTSRWRISDSALYLIPFSYSWIRTLRQSERTEAQEPTAVPWPPGPPAVGSAVSAPEPLLKLKLLKHQQSNNNNNVLFYVLFLQSVAHSPLQNKEQNTVKTNFQERARTHTHTHTQKLWTNVCMQLGWGVVDGCYHVSAHLLHEPSLGTKNSETPTKSNSCGKSYFETWVRWWVAVPLFLHQKFSIVSLFHVLKLLKHQQKPTESLKLSFLFEAFKTSTKHTKSLNRRAPCNVQES